MTKEITKAYIIQQIQDKLGLRELEPERFAFSEMVTPTYDIEQHLKTWLVTKQELSVTATGGLLLFIVPGNSRYTVSGYTVLFLAAGAYKVAGVYFTRKNDHTRFVYLDLTKNQTESYTVNLPKPLTLDSGDKLYINVDDYTSTADLTVYIDIEVEDLR